MQGVIRWGAAALVALAVVGGVAHLTSGPATAQGGGLLRQQTNSLADGTIVVSVEFESTGAHYLRSLVVRNLTLTRPTVQVVENLDPQGDGYPREMLDQFTILPGTLELTRSLPDKRFRMVYDAGDAAWRLPEGLEIGLGSQ